MSDNEERIVAAALDVVEVWREMVGGFHDFGTYTCSEIEAFAALARAVTNDGLAEQMIAEHAIHDEEGDAHYAQKAEAERLILGEEN